VSKSENISELDKAKKKKKSAVVREMPDTSSCGCGGEANRRVVVPRRASTSDTSPISRHLSLSRSVPDRNVSSFELAANRHLAVTNTAGNHTVCQI